MDAGLRAVNLSPEKQVCDLGVNRDVDVYITSEHMNLKKTRQKATKVTITRPVRSQRFTCIDLWIAVFQSEIDDRFTER